MVQIPQIKLNKFHITNKILHRTKMFNLFLYLETLFFQDLFISNRHKLYPVQYTGVILVKFECI